MAATENKSAWSNPPAWLSILISAALAYGAARYESGRKDENYERRITTLEKFKTDTEADWKEERKARDAQYLAAEAARNLQKDAAVQQMQSTTEELRNQIQTLKSGSNGNK